MGVDTLTSRDVLAGPPSDSHHDPVTDSSPVSRDADLSGRLVKAPGANIQNLRQTLGFLGGQ